VPTGQVQNVTPIPVRAPDVRTHRTQPLMFSPLDAHTLYYAANRLYRTTDGGRTWQTVSPDLAREAGAVPSSVGELRQKGAEAQRGVIYALGLSPLDRGRLWAGTDDGFIWVSADGGGNWSNITPAELTPWSKVTQIEASHFDVDTAYVSVSRMRIDDLHPYIYRTRDRGKTWQPIVAGLPADAPVNAVREDPERRGLLFAATESAVWVSFDDGDQWQSLQLNLPHTSMRDLSIHEDDLILATHGRSIWILDDITRLRQLPQGAMRDAVLFRPAAAYRMHRSTWSDTPIPPDEPLAENPPPGAILEFFLPRDARAPVVLEVLDGSGAVVRRFRSDDAPQPSAEELARELIPSYWIKPPRVLPARAGMHRWVWDLRYAAPLAVVRGYPISAVPHATPRQPEGPLAVPGNYRVRLTYDGQRLEAPLTLKPDPRVRATAEALARQLALATRLADLLTQSSRAVLTAQSMAAQLKALTATGATRDAVRNYQGRLASLTGSTEPNATDTTAESATPQPGATPPPNLKEVQEQIAGLYAELTRGDGEPTAAQAAATTAVEGTLARLMETWQKLQADLPELNKRLTGARLAPIRTDLAPPRDANLADEE